VDSTGAVYVSEENGIHKYVPSGSAPVNGDNTANFTGVGGCDQLAAGAGSTAGYIFAVPYSGELYKLDSASGEVKYSVTSEAVTASVDPSTGYVYAMKENSFRAYDASGAASAALVSKAQFNAGRGLAVSAATHNVFVSREPPEHIHIDVYGPAQPAGPEPPELLNAGNVYGTIQVGGSIHCEPGSWNGEPTVSYQWLRDGAEIPSTSHPPAARPPPPTSRHAGRAWKTPRNTTMRASSTATCSTTTARRTCMSVVVTTTLEICTRWIWIPVKS
jgi:hypothetical protein